jgi:gas vesicle protein
MGNNNKNSNKYLFFAGAVAGGALMYFMQTPRGRKLRAALSEQADHLSTQVQDKASELTSVVKHKADEVLSNASHAVSNMKEKVLGATQHMAQEGEETIDEFQHGIDRAHAHIESKLKS